MRGTLWNNFTWSSSTCIFASAGSIPRREQACSMKTGMKGQWTIQIPADSRETTQKRISVQSNESEKSFFRFVRNRSIPRVQWLPFRKFDTCVVRWWSFCNWRGYHDFWEVVNSLHGPLRLTMLFHLILLAIVQVWHWQVAFGFRVILLG